MYKREQSRGATGTRPKPSKVTECGANTTHLNQFTAAGPAPFPAPGLRPTGVEKAVSCGAGNGFVACFPGQRSTPSTPGSCSF